MEIINKNKKQLELSGGYDKEKQQKEAIYQMWQEIFADPVDFANYYYREMYPENRVYLMWHGREETSDSKNLCGMIHLNPYLMKLGQKQQILDYIVGVAVDSKMRRCGIMRKMLYEVMETMRQEKKPFTYLMPANPAYYTPFDFRFVYERFLWKPEKIEFTTNHFTFVSYEEKSHFVLLESYCEQFFADIQVTPIRTKRYLERVNRERKSEKGELIVIFKEDKCVGYLTYGIEEETCVVQEIITIENVKEVLNDFWTIKGFTKKKAWLDFFHNLLEFEKLEKTPMIMFRILEVQKAMKLVQAQKEMTLIIQVEDPFLKENSGVYEWHLTKEETTVRKTLKKPELTVTIAQLTEIIFGTGTENIIPFKQIHISEIV